MHSLNFQYGGGIEILALIWPQARSCNAKTIINTYVDAHYIYIYIYIYICINWQQVFV